MTPATLSFDERLAAFFAAWRERPFEWAAADCCQFAKAAVREIHGLHVPIAPVYRDAKEALQAVRSLGGFEGILQAAGLVPRPAAALAARGDVLIVTGALPFRRAMALCIDGRAFAPGKAGLIEVKRRHWHSAWGV